jgi:hypothetical protein
MTAVERVSSLIRVFAAVGGTLHLAGDELMASLPKGNEEAREFFRKLQMFRRETIRQALLVAAWQKEPPRCPHCDGFGLCFCLLCGSEDAEIPACLECGGSGLRKEWLQ